MNVPLLAVWLLAAVGFVTSCAGFGFGLVMLIAGWIAWRAPSNRIRND